MYIEIDRNSSKPLHKQLYDQLIEMILKGELKANTKLPGSRSLSKELNIARNCVTEVYEQLLSEGYLITKKGSGTYINDINVPKKTIAKDPKTIILKTEKQFQFEAGIPDLSQVPIKSWNKLHKLVLETGSLDNFNYGDFRGNLDLRQEIKHYLLRNKGIDCSEENIVIISGTTQGVFILSKIFGSVILEDPSIDFIQSIFKSNGMKIEYAEVDDKGIIPNKLNIKCKSELVMVSPSHQFPIGGNLPINRRIQLIEYAQKYNKYIIEDDYDSEFRFQGSPVNSIYRLSPEHVIHIGTFSKTFSPGIRLGYMIVPDRLFEDVITVKSNYNLLSPGLIQSTMALFIKEGFLEKHIFKMKKRYKGKLDYFISKLKDIFNDDIELCGISTGLHFLIRLKNVNSKFLLEETIKLKLQINLVSRYSNINKKYDDFIVVGFANLTNEDIDKGVDLLKRAYLKAQ